MTSSLITYITSAAGGLCCCAFWIGLLILAFWFFMRRGKGKDDGAGAAKAAIDEKISADATNKAADMKAATPEPAMAATGPSEAEDAEDAATVIAPQPPKGDMPASTPPKAAPPKPAPRVSGATIIAFDDDLADDE